MARRNRDDATFEDVWGKKLRSPDGKTFVIVARRVVVTDKGRKPFIAISRGYVTKEGEEKFTRGVGLPDNPEMLDAVIRTLTQIRNQ